MEKGLDFFMSCCCNLLESKRCGRIDPGKNKEMGFIKAGKRAHVASSKSNEALSDAASFVFG